MNYCEKIRQSMIDGDDDSVVKYIKKSLLSGYDPKYILKNILIDALSLIAKKEEKNECLIGSRFDADYIRLHLRSSGSYGC